MSVSQAWQWVKGQLKEQNASHEAKELLCFALNCSLSELLLKWNEELPSEAEKRLINFVIQRINGRPLAYILGEWSLMGLEFFVQEGILIPREDTEVLIRTALSIAQARNFHSALDLCCGSGCVGISLAKLSDMQVMASDINEIAIEITKKNAKRNEVDIQCIQSNLFEKINQKFDMIASNPPYISAKEMAELDNEVKDFEPHAALFGGEDGLKFYRSIIEQSKEFLSKRGCLIFEIGYQQANPVCSLFQQAGFEHIHVVKDTAGLDRVVFGYWE